MSGKIKSKDLSYDSTLPPFLQRLRGQHTGTRDADLHERQIARPKKARDHNDEDEPTVVDESGDFVTKDELAKRLADENTTVSGPQAATDDPKAPVSDARRPEQSVTDGIASKKRKAVRAIGADDAAEALSNDTASETVSVKQVRKAKKKVKTVKLAFAEDGE